MNVLKTVITLAILNIFVILTRYFIPENVYVDWVGVIIICASAVLLAVAFAAVSFASAYKNGIESAAAEMKQELLKQETSVPENVFVETQKQLHLLSRKLNVNLGVWVSAFQLLYVLIAVIDLKNLHGEVGLNFLISIIWIFLVLMMILTFVLSGIFRSKGWWKACNKIIELRNDHRENTPDNEI